MDFEALLVVGMFVVFLGALVALIVTGTRAEKRRQASFAELAARRGWTYRYEAPGRGRKAGIYRFEDPDADWTIEVVRRRSTGGGGKTSGTSHPGRTEFRRATPALTGGLVMATAGSPGATGRLAVSMPGIFDNAIGRSLLARIVGQDVAANVGALQRVPMPENLRLDVMATANPARWFDMEAISQAIHAWKPVGRVKHAPVLRISDQGLSLGLAHECSEAETIEKFADLAQGLAERLARR